jgi:putative peptidoglycan lipid II flippase
MSQLLKSSGAMGAATLISRILGMVREIVYAQFMGDTPVASAFKLAFQIPNLFRRLLGEGALSAAFIPVFKDKEKNAGESEMWRAANAVLSGLVIVALGIIVLAVLGITLVLLLGTPAPVGPQQLESTAQITGTDFSRLASLQDHLHPNTLLLLHLTRLMFPYMLLVCVAAVFMGILNARGFFFIPAMSATTLNLVMIASVLFLAPRFGATLDTQIYALAIGVLVAGVVQAGCQYPALYRDGFRLRWVSPWKNAVVREVVRKMIPGIVGVSAYQFNVLLTYGLAYCVDQTMVASFDYAVRLMELPQGVFGVSLATYLLTTLSGLAAEKNYPEFRQNLTHGLGLLIFANLIASILLTIMAEPIIRLLLEHGSFDRESTRRAAQALRFLAPGLLLFSIVNVLSRAFYALGDTKTPMRISVVCLSLNLLFVFFLVSPLRQAGLGLANTMSAGFNLWLLAYALRRTMPKLDFAPVWMPLRHVGSAGLAAGIIAWLTYAFWERQWGHHTLLEKLGEVFLPLSLAGSVYWAVCFWLKVPQAREIWDWVKPKTTPKADPD